MKKKKYFLIAAFLILSIWGVVKYRAKSTTPATNPVWVAATKVTQNSIPYELHATGTITARSVEISPELAGHVKAILFKDGTFVEKETPLIQLDDEVWQTKFKLAKAKVFYSNTNYHRMLVLDKKGAIAKQAIDQAAADFKEKQADLDENRVMLNKMKLLAPFSGTVGKSKINPGDYVTVGQSLVTLTDTQLLRVEYNIPEKHLAVIKLGQTISLTTTAYPNKTFNAKVAYIAPTINVDNRSLAVYAELENSEKLLAAGMFVNITHVVGQRDNVLLVPSRSLVRMLESEQLYKIVDGKAYAVPVTTGYRDKEFVQILSGVKAGETIVTDGQLKIRNNMPVKVKL